MPANTAETLNVLAQMKDPGKRRELAMGVVDLCLAQPLSPTADPVAGELLVTLSAKSDTATKAEIAARLAPCDWAPHDIIRFLAFEPIEVSAVIIEKSSKLTQKDMIELAESGTTEHRKVLAMRANLCLAVSDTLARPGEAIVLRALANNSTAEISENTLDICLTVARDNPKLREALARRHDLTTDFATQLCIMLPENWREELYRRFGLDKDKVEALAVETALSATPEDVDKDAARRVNDAAKDGKLDGKYALDALVRGEEAVFDHAIAHLCGIKVSQWRIALAMGGVRAAAMACQAANLERTAYPVIHKALQRSGRMHQALEGDAMSAAANVFRMYGPEKAAKVLRQMGSRG
ncbi:DUF2336 domain-containing protein [Maricaulis sp.]|uniref:DUF2336 domain-containing protein n=1 Tax=Maricaulis sp. TaxID=1486257 RepID=UPI001B117FAE|nr:DUF2336 domain-containing protein [Maricaulis sp.]MBO6765586.1 DUF2336 domain-containing protein [Maricaulis sp.]